MIPLNNKYHLGSLLLSLVFPLALAAQSDQPIRSGYRLLINPTQLLLGDAQMTFERTINHANFGLTAGYRPSFRNQGSMDGISGGGLDYWNLNFRNGLYQGLTFGLNGRYYPEYEGFYLEMALFYRKWWFDNKRASYSDQFTTDNEYDGLRSEEVNVFGLKYHLGYTIDLGQTATLDLYTGFGIRRRSVWYQTRPEQMSGGYGPPETGTGVRWMGSIQLGCKIGLQLQD